MSQTVKTGAAHSPKEPQRANPNYKKQISQARKQADEEVESSFLYMLLLLQRYKLPAMEFEAVTMQHTAWRLRNLTVKNLTEAVAS